MGNQIPTEENLIIDEVELRRLSQEWGKPIDELMEDLEEIEEESKMLNLNTIIKANYGHGFQTIEWNRNHNWEVEHEGKHYVLLENAEMVSCCATDGSVEWEADAICLEDNIEDGFLPRYSVYFSPVDGWEEFCTGNDESRCCDWDTPDRIEEYDVVKAE